jgi:hypothetical protein
VKPKKDWELGVVLLLQTAHIISCEEDWELGVVLIYRQLTSIYT